MLLKCYVFCNTYLNTFINFKQYKQFYTLQENILYKYPNNKCHTFNLVFHFYESISMQKLYNF